MNYLIKRNDNQYKITYSLVNDDGSIPNLTNATVNFNVGNATKILFTKPAVIENAGSGIVSYTLTDEDTLYDGLYRAEFVATLQDGTLLTYPRNGYISINIQKNVDTSLSNITLDAVAERQGDFTNKLDSILQQAGNITMSTMNEYTWTSNAGQLTYVMPTGANYDPFGKWFEVYVGNAVVPPGLIDRSVQNQFTLLVSSSSILAGLTVLARWTEPIVPITVGHHTTHELNGSDPIDITKMQNYQSAVGTPIANNTTSLANITSKKIYAKDHGVKLDGVTDDTAALNSFFALFGTGVELVVDNGVALVTGQLNLPGQWNPSSNNGLRKLTFNNASINYQGLAGKACFQIYNHQKSVIDGLSILKGSQDTYINIVGFWYSKLVNFEVPRIRFNYNTTDITATLQTADSYTSVFERGITYHGSEFYGVGQTGGGNINSITFNDVKWQGNQVTPNAQYNLKFYGTSFQNFAFNYCDLSYATIADIYIDVAQSPVMRLNFYSCYFDTNIPMVPNNDFKGAIVSLNGTQSSNGQVFFVKTRNMLSSTNYNTYALEAGTPKHGGLNIAKNGDFFYPTLSGWQYSGNNTSGGGIGAPIVGFLSNTNAINKYSLQVTFQQTQQYWAITGISAPMDAPYTMSVRLRKVAGNGSIQLAFKNGTPTFDLTPYALNEELILSTSGAGSIITQGTSMFGTLYCTALGSSPFIIEILEVTIVAGNNVGINLNVHPQANMMPVTGTTSSRPHTMNVMQPYFDTSLTKPIWVKYMGVREVDTLTISSGATSSGNITITLNGVGTAVAVSAGDSAGTIGDKIRVTAFSGWIAGGTGGSSIVTFTKQSSGTNTAPAFADTGTTGTAASFAVTTSGATAAWMDNTGATV